MFLFLLLPLHVIPFVIVPQLWGYSAPGFPSFFFLFAFQFGNWHFSSSELCVSFLGHVPSTDSPIKIILHFCYRCTDFFNHFLLIISISISLFTLPIFYHMLYTFSIGSLSILITVILNPQPDNFNICVIYGFDSGACFDSPGSVFSLSWIMPVIFCWKSDMVHQAAGVEVSRTSEWGFLFPW